ncbi:MinD/ParA family protein [Amphritea sp. HPY]|uniref:MinD/ParA family protein n=1 Tax=Amphritea sp. HPY TaxID=3421652 RepID=UPI003D7D2B85
MSSPRPVKVIAVTGGKGGVGKTNVSVNMSLALGEMGQRVVLMDADLGLANVDVLLGVKAEKNISDVLSGDCSLKDLLINVDENVRIVPAASGTQEMTSLSVHEHSELIHAFSEIGDDLDVLVIDTAAGISDAVVSFVKAAQDVIVVVCDEPTSITDAYALMKLLNRDYNMTRFRVLANMVRSEQEGRNMFNKLLTVTDRFLDVTLQYLGSIPYDESVRKGVRKQRAVLKAFPNSKAALAYKQLATRVETWPVSSSSRGHLEFFVERLVKGA